jgi:benzoate-CoA ligase
MMKVSGVWVSPIEVESVLMEHPAVLEAAVVFQKDVDELSMPVACVVPQNEIAPTSELARELQEFVLDRLPVFKRPRRIEFLSELPKTATGKLQRFKLRERLSRLT